MKLAEQRLHEKRQILEVIRLLNAAAQDCNLVFATCGERQSPFRKPTCQ